VSRHISLIFPLKIVIPSTTLTQRQVDTQKSHLFILGVHPATNISKLTSCAVFFCKLDKEMKKGDSKNINCSAR